MYHTFLNNTIHKNNMKQNLKKYLHFYLYYARIVIDFQKGGNINENIRKIG